MKSFFLLSSLLLITLLFTNCKKEEDDDAKLAEKIQGKWCDNLDFPFPTKGKWNYYTFFSNNMGSHKYVVADSPPYPETYFTYYIIDKKLYLYDLNGQLWPGWPASIEKLNGNHLNLHTQFGISIGLKKYSLGIFQYGPKK